ncbi:hypothetical protein ACHAXT_008574 [Thalassiosira profunda]
MPDLPPGWGDRHNQMSEHDIALGGMAATKFGGTARNAYESGAGDGGSKNSDQVRDFYLHEFQRGQKSGVGVGGGGEPSVGEGSTGAKKGGGVPDFWEARQQERELQSKQMGVFSKSQPPKNNVRASGVGREAKEGATGNDMPASSAEVALVQVATHALEKMAETLRGKDAVKIPMAERAAFASAVKEAMDALARQA